jgi:hypothetical protein
MHVFTWRRSLVGRTRAGGNRGSEADRRCEDSLVRPGGKQHCADVLAGHDPAEATPLRGDGSIGARPHAQTHTKEPAVPDSRSDHRRQTGCYSLPTVDVGLQPLLVACRSAELTVAGLRRVGREKSAPGWAVNAFSVLHFTTDPLPDGERKPTYLTTRPESSPDGKHQLFVVQTPLAVQEALPLCEFGDQFVDPRAPASHGPIDSPGAWVGPAFVERYEDTVRSCVPPIDRAFWLKEHWQPPEALQAEIDDKGLGWLQARLQALLGISLATRRERLGNFLAVLPEYRIRMRTRPSQTKELIGVEVVDSAPDAPRDLLLVARGSRDRHVQSAVARLVRRGLHVLPMNSAIDYREVELYDATSGLILDREAGVPLREMVAAVNLVTTRLDVTILLTRPDGTPDGEPVRVQTDWSASQPIRVGGRARWEERLQAVRNEEQLEQLRANGHFFMYRGDRNDRKQAVEDIRRILHTRLMGIVKIWDPYFGHRDAAEFLFYVAAPTTPIQVLTSLHPTDDETSNHRAVRDDPNRVSQPLADWKREQMSRVLRVLREPRQGTPGLTQLEVRSGGVAFHDRFILTEGRCWQAWVLVQSDRRRDEHDRRVSVPRHDRT